MPDPETATLPLYRQLMRRIAAEIESGRHLPHSKLLSEREWSEEIGVSRITIRQALSALVQQGVLYTVPGKGFFVAPHKSLHELNALLSFTAAVLARGEVPSSKVLTGKLVPASAAMAAVLQITPGAEVVVLRRLRRANKVPIMLQESWLPHALCPGVLDRDLENASLYEILREHHGVKLSRAQTTVTARPAVPDEIRRLQLEDPVVLLADQITFGGAGKPVERSLSALHPLRHPLSLVQDEFGRALSGI